MDSTQLIHELLQQNTIGEFLGKRVRESAKPTKYTDKWPVKAPDRKRRKMAAMRQAQRDIDSNKDSATG